MDEPGILIRERRKEEKTQTGEDQVKKEAEIGMM